MTIRVRHLVLTSAFAGVERHVCVLANEQARRGHDVEVWGGLDAMMQSHLHERVRRSPARNFLTVAGRAVVGRQPDLVHAHMTAAEAAALAPRVLRATPLVVTRHFAAVRGASAAGRLARRLIHPRVDAQIAISQYVADAVDGATTVVYPGVAGPVRDEESQRRPVALVVQRLQAEKRTDVALRLFAAGAPTSWTLEVVGVGAELARLQTLARDLGIAERTTFLGFRDDVPYLMDRASVLLAPCEVEGLGLSVLEAMAQGLPVLASDAGAHPETVGKASDAQLFPVGEISQGAAMLAELCSNVDLRQRYGEQLRSVQKTNFTPGAQGDATDTVYRTVLR